jgi:hypothetical protein
VKWISPEHEGCKFCFPGLTFDENEDIVQARAWGYAEFFPSFPDGESQARRTLEGSRKFLADNAERIKRDSSPFSEVD